MSRKIRLAPHEAAVRQALQDITQEHSDANQEGSAQRSSEAPKDSFPTYRNPITPQEGIILTGSAATIWAEAIIHRAPGVDVDHPPSTLTYRNLKKRKNNSPPSPAPQPDPHCTGSVPWERRLDEYYSLGKNASLPQYIEFCQYPPKICLEELKKFCVDQFINNYHQFGDDLVVDSLINEYHCPRGLAVSLRNNFD
ncbi:hypothetical protein H4Q26_012715 [Puccinia striiformis f. sp. tritici PST-130]|nr:hypothetical protein H4Q26_012715 [Puccinia striiformis f. sp. tritici PST-130]